jgi:hypothetical protein
LFVPTTLPIKTAAATNASQPKNAVFQCAAAHRPARPAKFTFSIFPSLVATAVSDRA